MDSPDEKFRVRNFVLSYFLEDATIQINEPQLENSGILQGTFLRRHRFIKDDGSCLLPGDIKCGTDLCLYSRVYRICRMDEFTTKFYMDQNMDPGLSEDVPEDVFWSSRSKNNNVSHRIIPDDVIKERALVEVMFGGTQVNRKTRQYLENDGKILCFRTYWDDDSEGGFRHFFDLHWFLADDSIELIEIFPKTESCAANRQSFLKRACVTTLAAALLKSDLIVGRRIRVTNRELTIFDCDTFTRQFYIDNFNILQASQPLEDDKLVAQNLPLSKEDLRLVPRRPRINVAKLEHTGTVLRFKAKQVAGDDDRNFIVGFYPEDDTIAVWEIPVRNSGLPAGKFAERGIKHKPKTTESHYTIVDLKVGNILSISGISFELIDADDFTKKWISRLNQSLLC